MHGSSTRAARQRAQERILEARAVEVLDREERPTGLDPLRELLRLAAETVALKDVLGARARDSQLGSAEIAVLGQSMDRAARVLSECSRLDLDARLAVIDQAQGRVIAAVIAGTLEEVGLDREGQLRGREIAARRLREAQRPATRL